MSQPPTVLYSAAHGGFSRQSVPLGGGAAVATALVSEWERTRPFPFRLLDPSLLGERAPTARDLVRFGERAYARFSRQFERAVTDEVLRYDPSSTVVLVNDISEGPDFRRLGEAGYALYTIWHVDVVAYVARIYARGLVSAETLVRWHDRLARTPLGSLMPDLAGLVFDKQRDSVRYSRGLIVPSREMRRVIESAYPPERRAPVHVLPWGTWARDADAGACAREVLRLRQEWQVPGNALCLLALSRISPEKGQDLLLEALLEWEREGPLPDRPLWLFVCGEAAFMQGARFLKRLRRLAARLRRIHVEFPGYVTGLRKDAMFALADLYVFPSRHESYGLTLMEALRAGLPAVSLDHHGAREVMRPEFGEMVRARSDAEARTGLRRAMARLLADDQLRRSQGEAARSYAEDQRFSDRAAWLARLLSGVTL